MASLLNAMDDAGGDPLRRAALPGDDLEARRAREAVAARLFGGSDGAVQVGRYQVRARLGSGGMGVVYRAHDPDLDRDVAVKLLAPEAARRGPEAGTARARLLREARAMARLAHPNVIHVYDVGTVDDGVFIAMELVVGQDLGAWLAERARPWWEVLDVCLQAGEGLAAAHAAGLVHRDFKPENVLVGTDGRVRVVDFGLAGGAVRDEALEDPDDDDLVADRDASPALAAGALTVTGAMLGTPRYMAPEQYEAAAQTTAQGDQFSFCVTLYEALYGQAPFAGDTLYAYRESVRAGRVRPPPPQASAPDALWRCIARGLAVAPEDRHPDMAALLGRLRTLRRRLDPRRRRRRRAIVSLAGAGALAAGLWSLLSAGTPAKDATAPPTPSQGPAVAAAAQPAEGAPTTSPAPREDRREGSGKDPRASSSEPAEGVPPRAPAAAAPPSLGAAPPPGDDPPPPRATARPRAAFAACYYNDRNKLLGKRKRHRRHQVLDAGTCQVCTQSIRTSALAGLRDARECRRHYRCQPAPESACPD